MKKLLLLSLMVVLGLSSCELNKNNADPELVLKIGKDLSYKYSNIELYDSSTHIVYFKELHPEFDKLVQVPFTFYANGTEIYTGSVWPAFYNSGPTGPFIYSPTIFYQNFAIRVDDWTKDKPDPRNDPVLMQSLKVHNLLHSGLSVEINPPVINGNLLTFLFTVTNQDKSDLLILDPDKTGTNLFHYFTNGLSIRNAANEYVFTSNIEVEFPSPSNIWKIEWLSSLKSGDSRQFTLNYTLSSALNQGEYTALFEFPGLTSQVSIDQLVQNGNRIWLGDVQANKRFTIQ